MSSITSNSALYITLLIGVGIWAGMARKLDAAKMFEYKPNVACLKGSPYGKVVALALQGPIDLYWHKGTTHEYEDLLSDGHGHDHGTHGHSHGSHGHGHDHGTHGHSHGGHSHGGHGHEHGSHGHEHGTHGHDHETHDHANHEHGAHGDVQGLPQQASVEENEPELDATEQPFHIRAKKLIKKMAATRHRKTDGKPLTVAHHKYLQGVTEDKLRLAYELDPSNYTNYGNYHLFLSSTSYGKRAYDDDAAVGLARQTLDFCKQDSYDPASWVTAASAAYNIIYHIGKYHEHFTVAQAKASLAQFDGCMREYFRLRDVAVREGRVMSQVRLDEMEQRVNYLGKLRYAQGRYMKRVMSGDMARNGNSSKNTD